MTGHKHEETKKKPLKVGYGHTMKWLFACQRVYIWCIGPNPQGVGYVLLEVKKK